MISTDETNLIISNEETKCIMKIVKPFKDSDLLRKAVTKAIKNEAKNKRVNFLVSC